MKVGRNEPCPCGSGRKYKHCCLRKEQEAARVRTAAAVPQPEAASEEPVTSEAAPPANVDAVPPPVTPPEKFAIDEAMDARWNAFKTADFEDRIALFYQTLEEKELMDGEMAFEMLTSIHDACLDRGERERIEELLKALRERLPEVYAEESLYFQDWRISNALATGRLAELAEPVHELFGCVSDKHIDLYPNVLDQLAYHAQLSVLLEAVSLAFPRIKASTDILPWAIDEFAQRASEYVIFDYLERQPSVAADDPELLARLEDYIEVDPARLAQRLAGLAGRSERDWTSDDFGLENEAYGQNVADLSFEFLAYLKQTEHVPYTKGNLAREQLVEYFLSRRDGKLGSRRRPKPHKRKKREPEAHQHQLCPDYATLNRFLAKRLQFLNLRYHQVAVVFELIPAWLRFLLSRQLIAPEMFEQTLQQLKPMRSDLLQIYSKYDDDPTLRVAVARWPAETADSGSQAH